LKDVKKRLGQPAGKPRRVSNPLNGRNSLILLD